MPKIKKPKTDAEIRALASAWDEAERAAVAGGWTEELWLIHRDAAQAYVSAILHRVSLADRRAEHRKDAPNRAEVRELLDDWSNKLDRHRLIEKAGLEFSTARERFDADVQQDAARSLYDTAMWKNAAKRLRDVPVSRCKRGIITDGLVRTGRYKMVDGVRVPVYLEVEGAR